MLIIPVIIIILAVVVSLLRLRLKAEISSGERLVAVLVGRSGAVWNFMTGTGEIRLFGWRLKRFPISAEAPSEAGREREATERKPAGEKKVRRRSLRDGLQLLPSVGRALWRYGLGLLQAVTVERLEADIEGGFEEPHLTGQAYGFYQAAYGVAPAVVSRVRYRPDWSGASFAGSAGIAVAIPLYRLMYRTLVLLWELPLRKILKLAIGTKEGVQDGQ